MGPANAAAQGGHDTAAGGSFSTLIQALPDIVYILDGDGHFIFLNDAVRSIGYEPASLIGKHFSLILHPDDRHQVSRAEVLAEISKMDAFPLVPPKLFDERRSGSRMTRELEVRILHGTTGDTVHASVNAYGEPVETSALKSMFTHEGWVTVGVIHDVTAARMYRRSLEESLAAKETLLRETHHRIRDNLQVVASLAHLREMELDDEATRLTLTGLVSQIKSIAVVHEALYRTENTEGASAREYFERFAALMAQSYGYIGSPVTVEAKAPDSMIEGGRLSYIAIIASELVADAYREAFPAGRGGRILVSYAEHEDRAELAVSDDGLRAAEPESAEPGSEIARTLARQLGGRLERRDAQAHEIVLVLPARS